MFRVKYLDSESDKAYVNFLRRSSELALDNGFEFFSVKDNSAKLDNNNQVASGGLIFATGLPEYEATIVLQKEKVADAFNAKELLLTNPIPKDTKR